MNSCFASVNSYVGPTATRTSHYYRIIALHSILDTRFCLKSAVVVLARLRFCFMVGFVNANQFALNLFKVLMFVDPRGNHAVNPVFVSGQAFCPVWWFFFIFSLQGIRRGVGVDRSKCDVGCLAPCCWHTPNAPRLLWLLSRSTTWPLAAEVSHSSIYILFWLARMTTSPSIRWVLANQIRQAIRVPPRLADNNGVLTRTRHIYNMLALSVTRRAKCSSGSSLNVST